MEQIFGFPCWTYLLGWTAWHTNNCSLHMVIQPVVHSSSTETISLCFTKENQGRECKNPQVKIFFLLLHYSPGELSLQRKKLDWSEAVSSWQDHADVFLSPHSLSILINCFVNSHGATDIMLMSESLKEHMTDCFPPLSFDKGVWVLWAKTTDASETPAKRAGGDGMMHVVVSSTRKLMKPRAWPFHHFKRKPQLKQRSERILTHSCVASQAYCKCLSKPGSPLQNDAGLGSISQETPFSVPQTTCALSHPSPAHFPGSPRKPLRCTSWSVGRARHARGPCAEKEGKDQQGWGRALPSAHLAQAGCPVPRVTFPSRPTGGSWRSWRGNGGMTPAAGAPEYMWTELGEHVLPPRSCLRPSLGPRKAETVNTGFADASWHDSWGHPRLEGTALPLKSAKDVSNLKHFFFMPCNKKLSWSSQFPCFCAPKLSRLPVMTGLDSYRRKILSVACSLLSLNSSVELNGWLPGCQHLGKALRG